MPYFKTFNSAMVTTAAPTAVATAATAKTMLQLAPPAGMNITVVSWGYTLSVTPGATGTIELIQTDVAATVTAHVTAGVYSLDPNKLGTQLTLGTAATGYTASAEGSTTATRLFDVDQIPNPAGEVPVNYDYQFVPDERPVVAAGKFLRVRATMPTSQPNMLCWVVWIE